MSALKLRTEVRTTNRFCYVNQLSTVPGQLSTVPGQLSTVPGQLSTVFQACHISNPDSTRHLP
ncbi:MAG: hypothetical protein JGK08_09055 [Microcoleus sp. PH2017_04_SCI_O_A]|nr:hypothetical protein [Microcoleus sp. PH2017_04_SCI_O_A]